MTRSQFTKLLPAGSLGQNHMRTEAINQSEKGPLIISDAYDRNVGILLLQLFELAGQLRIDSKDQDTDHV